MWFENKQTNKKPWLIQAQEYLTNDLSPLKPIRSYFSIQKEKYTKTH